MGWLIDVIPQDGTSVLGEIGHAVHSGGLLYHALQLATMVILIFAATIGFTGFSRLTSVLGWDDLMPHQSLKRGDRLVFSNGIID